MDPRLLLALCLLAWSCIPRSLLAGILDDSSYGYMLPSPPEVAIWWCEATWKVGRERALPQATNEAVQIEAARNEYEPFQLVLRPTVVLSNVTVSVSDLVRSGAPPNAIISATNCQVCLVDYVPVTEASDEFGAPGWYPDPLFPLTGPVALAAQTNQPFWITVYVPKDTAAGLYKGTIIVNAGGTIQVPVQLRVFDFTLPDTTHTRSAFFASIETAWPWHGPISGEQTNQLWELYMQNFRTHRLSPYSAHLYAPITWSYTNGDFLVDFGPFDCAMKRYLDEFGFNSFNLMGHKSPPFPFVLETHSAFTAEYRALFGALMSKIMSHLRENDWVESAYCYWFDEPIGTNIAFCVSGMDAIRNCAPGLKTLVTLAVFPPPDELVQSVDIPTPLIHRSDWEDYQQVQARGYELWSYLACYPLYPSPNFFIDHPAVNHRIVFWYVEKQSLSGLLYWGVNYWPTNVWQMPKGRENVPNGDGLLWYPPVKTLPTDAVVAPPVNSLRWELIREGLEDKEYFWLLKQAITNAMLVFGPDSPTVRQAIDIYADAVALANSLSNSTSYCHDPLRLLTARRGMAEAIEMLDAGRPFFVRHPRSKAVSMGETITLCSEALGWPSPLYQWRLNGMDLAGATNAVLTINNIGWDELGDYTVVAWNQLGRATSAVARVRGRWLESPQIVAEPRSAVKCEGDYAVFSVTAVSANPCTYQWFKDGTPLDGPYSTNSVLLITNLSWQHNGYYTVLVSNAFGATTAGPARLVVLCDQQGKTVFPTASVWRYHDLGQGLGTNWVNLDFDDSSWSDGQAPLGFGTGRESTLICTGQVTTPTTVYFRCTFDGAALPQDATCFARLRCDDGAVVYLNGTEVFRYNLPEGIISFDTSALTPVEGTNQDTLVEFVIPANLFIPGTNLLAAEVHQCTVDIAKPIAFWTLDESEPPWRDTIGGHDLTMIGTNIVPCAGKVGGCVSNSASATSWLTTPNTVALQFGGPFTVGGWFAFGQQYGNDPATTCIQKEGEFRLYYTGTVTNRYRFRVGQTEVQDQTPGTVSGQWRFVVGWYDGTNAYIQVDNGPVYSAPAEPPDPTTNPVVLLKRSGTGGFAADEVFFYKRVLNAQERTALYTQGLRVVLSSMVEDLLFDLEIFAVAAQPPIFIDAPADLTVWEGQNAGFRLLAYSKTSVTYQWLFNGVPIDGATNSLLFLAAVRPEQSGLYSLVASNIGGAVTSAPACLTVLSLPRLGAHLGDGGALVLELPACIVASTVLTSTNLIDWEPVLTREAGAGPTNHVVEIVPTELQRYYRLRLDW